MTWKHQIKIGAFLIMMLTMLTYMGASAFAEFGFAPPPASDMSRSFLNQIFGGLLDGGQDAFGGSIKSFNAAVLVVGGILAAYTILSATLGTAHDGEMLGKKFSSVWIPIRYTLGTALVLPVLSGGYCIMQGIVMWLIMQGVSIANGVWSEYMANPPGLTAMMSKTPPLELVQLAENIYLMQVCVQANKALGAPDSLWSNLFGSNGTEWSAKRVFSGHWTFGYSQFLSSYSCGSISFPGGDILFNSNTSQDNSNSNRYQSKEFTIPSIDSMKTVFKSPSYYPVMASHNEATDTLVGAMGTLAQEYVGKDTAPPADAYNKIIEAAQAYQKTVNDSAVALLGQDNNIKEASTAQGWFVAGAWITQVIIHQNKLNSSLTRYPEVNNLRIGTDSDKKIEPFSKQANNALLVIAPTNPLANNFIVNSTSPSKKEGTNEGADSDVPINGKIGQWLASFISGIDIEEIKNDKRHPIIIMSSVGNSILNSILIAAISAATSAAIIAGGFFTGMPILAALIVKYGTFAFPIAGFIGIGATLAYIIPNLPFILWIGIIIGWTVMCVEAILAAPLWAVMHLHPNGDDLTGKGANGYMLVLGLLLRPALIIFGLIAAITLSGLFGQLVNAIFFNTFAMNQGDSSLGFFAILFGTGLYAAIMMTVIKQCFNLMHMIPDQLLRWIGGGQEQLGQYAGASSEAITKGGMIGGMAAGLVTTDVMKAGQGAASGYIDKMKQQEQSQSALNSDNSKVMDKLGSSAGAVMSAIDGNHGGGFDSSGKLNDPMAAMNSHEAVKQKSEFQALSKSFEDPTARESFNEAMAKGLNDNLSFNDARDQALSQTIGKHFGGNNPSDQAQAVGFAQKLSNGRPSSGAGDPGSWGSIQDTSRAITAMSNVQQMGGRDGDTFNEKAGQETLRDAMSAAIQSSTSDTTSLRNAFNAQSNSIAQGIIDNKHS